MHRFERNAQSWLCSMERYGKVWQEKEEVLHNVCNPMCRGRYDGQWKRASQCTIDAHSDDSYMSLLSLSRSSSISLTLPFLSFIHVCLHRTLRYIRTGVPPVTREPLTHTRGSSSSSSSSSHSPTQKVHKVSSFTSISSAVASSVASCRFSYARVFVSRRFQVYHFCADFYRVEKTVRERLSL